MRDLQARVSFTGAGMEILGRSGRIGGATLSEVRAHTPNLRRAGPPLRITGQAAGELRDMQAFLDASPLGERYRGLAGKLRPTGPAGLELELKIPLRPTQGAFGMKGTLRLADNRLRVEEYALDLEGLQGQVLFTEASIGSRELQGRLWDAPLRIDLDTRPAREGGYHRIRLQSRLDLIGRLREREWPLAERFDGQADWRAEIRVQPPQPGEATALYLELGSDLRGIGVTLPPPLAKAASDARPLRLWRTLSAGRTGPLWVQYGEDLQAVLDLEATATGQRLVRGAVQFGSGVAQLPDAEVLRLAGRLPRLSLADWLPQPATGGDAVAPALPPLEVDLALQELEIQNRLVREVGLRVRREDSDWAVELSGRGAQGQLQLTPGTGGLERIRAELDHLRIVPPPDGPALPQEQRPDPRTLPALSIRIGELSNGGRLLGDLRLETARRADGLRVEQLALVAEDYRLQLQGDWVMTAAEQPVSRFELQLEEGNLGALLEAFHHERIM
ncbi:MAG TPA: DUF3971 domain-containing protein, partial [bacterium]